MGLQDNAEIRKIAWQNHHKTLGKGLIEGIILENGGPIAAVSLARRLKEIFEHAALEAGINGLSAAMWDELVTDNGGMNREQTSQVRHGRFSYDPETMHVTTPYHPHPIGLTIIEGKIFYPLILNAPRIITHNRLTDLAWGYDNGLGGAALLKTHMVHIRKKIGDVREGSAYNFRHIVVTPGVGYRFQDKI